MELTRDAENLTTLFLRKMPEVDRTTLLALANAVRVADRAQFPLQAAQIAEAACYLRNGGLQAHILEAIAFGVVSSAERAQAVLGALSTLTTLEPARFTASGQMGRRQVTLT